MISVIIPVHNEEAVLESLSRTLTEALNARHIEHELLLCENGSTDATLDIARQLALEIPTVRVETLTEASYGAGLRHGIATASGDPLVIFNADLWDIEFLERSLQLLKTYDCVVGSKLAPGAHDRRSPVRRFISFSFNLILRALFEFKGTDTHGMKAFRREVAAHLIAACVTNAEILDTEIILRAEREGRRIAEVPVHVREVRPSRYGLLMRVPGTVRDIATLYRALGRLER